MSFHLLEKNKIEKPKHNFDMSMKKPKQEKRPSSDNVCGNVKYALGSNDFILLSTVHQSSQHALNLVNLVC